MSGPRRKGEEKTMGLAVMALAPSAHDVDGGHPWSGSAATHSLRRFVEKGQIMPARTLLLSAGMQEEAKELAGLGFRVVAVDADGIRLKALEASARREGFAVTAVSEDFLTMPPALAGPVELIVDRLYLHELPPARRAEWGCKAGRILPMGGLLAGCFLIARSTEGPPYPLLLDDLKRLTARFFTIEVLEPVGTAEPGRPRAYRGLFRRK